MYTDSQICIHWHRTADPATKLIVFVYNRIIKIKESGFPITHVKGVDNPADLYSRGIPATKLTSKFITQGPSWLTKPEETWDNPPADYKNIDLKAGFKKDQAIVCATTIDMPPAKPYSQILVRRDKTSRQPATTTKKAKQFEKYCPIEYLYYSAKQMISLTSALFHYAKRLKTRAFIRKNCSQPTIAAMDKNVKTILRHAYMGHDQKQPNISTVAMKLRTSEIIQWYVEEGGRQMAHEEEATNYWIHYVQKTAYANDIKHLQNSDNPARRSTIAHLAPFLHKGRLRVGGRLHNANLPIEMKHPFILPKRNRFTRGLYYDAHYEMDHFTTEAIIQKVRQTWFSDGARDTAKNVRQHCVQCMRQTAKPASQQMATLPTFVFKENDPCFAYTSLDYTAPFKLRVLPPRRKKRRGQPPPEPLHDPYEIVGIIAVFTCFYSHAVHLELVTDGSTGQFLGAFKNFVGRRGLPKLLFSDNATCFRESAKKIIKQVNKTNKRITEESRKLRFEWRFSTPLAPHTAGRHEAAVGLVKKCLYKVLKDQSLTYTEMQTAMIQAESYINDKPISCKPTSADTLEVITPSLLMRGAPLNPWVDVFEASDIKPSNIEPNMHVRWKRRNACVAAFKNYWRNTSMLDAQTRSKWFTSKPDIKPGDLVLVKEGLKKRQQWPIGRVMDWTYERKPPNDPTDKPKIRSVRICLMPECPRTWTKDEIINTTLPKKEVVRSIHHIYPLLYTNQDKAEQDIRNYFDKVLKTPKEDVSLATNVLNETMKDYSNWPYDTTVQRQRRCNCNNFYNDIMLQDGSTYAPTE